VTYRVFLFDSGTSDIRTSDESVVTDIASYLEKNPSLEIGIDGYMDSQNRELSTDRVNAVRSALIGAGVSENRIKVGAFGNAKERRNGRVEVLLQTAK
jgi:outer membrane protein OmpA-like peptidoglycan-associated protein